MRLNHWEPMRLSRERVSSASCRLEGRELWCDGDRSLSRRSGRHSAGSRLDGEASAFAAAEKMAPPVQAQLELPSGDGGWSEAAIR